MYTLLYEAPIESFNNTQSTVQFLYLAELEVVPSWSWFFLLNRYWIVCPVSFLHFSSVSLGTEPNRFRLCEKSTSLCFFFTPTRSRSSWWCPVCVINCKNTINSRHCPATKAVDEKNTKKKSQATSIPRHAYKSMHINAWFPFV